MSDVLHQRLARLADPQTLPLLRQLRHGIEKESLRIDSSGRLAQTPHSHLLGSALTHPLITTDYSEALLEFITLVSADISDAAEQLDLIHRFTYANIGDENLWTASMPCVLESDAEIPVAQYGRANNARMKTIYRMGLGYRYGRRMQTISGIHYNFSLPESLWPALCEVPAQGGPLQQQVTAQYFSLIRNFRRYSWLLIYLFGASPALSKSFLDGRAHRLQELDPESLYQPFATSLRMGDLGYQSNAQENLQICYNRLDSYVDTLKQAILNPHPDYERIGVNVEGEYRQLSTGLLQIENEFYSPIRPKRVAKKGETALTALAARGVEYIEVRCIDVNPFLPVGIDEELMRFLDAFLLFCLLEDSPEGNPGGIAEVKANMKKVVDEGRRPQLQLTRDGKAIGLKEWADQLLDGIEHTASLLDQAHGSTRYRDSHTQQRRRVADPDLTPSAQVLRELKGERLSYAEFVRAKSEQHGAYFRNRPLPEQLYAQFVEMAERSLKAQEEIEAADNVPFDTYLQRYFEQYQAL